MAEKEAPKIPTSTGKKSAPNSQGNRGGSLTGSGTPNREKGGKQPPRGGKK
ncbi:hypothetical protein [Pimelobacter sp. 30-1]|uniref:hypothetical protein n=1 Tax=Pimelobacter sp. 30-1 TaxID=2004991 RepID=UPI001C0536A6|nr:hypothetical protein [Pimelobacter sp. 30-1]